MSFSVNFYKCHDDYAIYILSRFVRLLFGNYPILFFINTAPTLNILNTSPYSWPRFDSIFFPVRDADRRYPPDVAYPFPHICDERTCGRARSRGGGAPRTVASATAVVGREMYAAIGTPATVTWERAHGISLSLRPTRRSIQLRLCMCDVAYGGQGYRV